MDWGPLVLKGPGGSTEVPGLASLADPSTPYSLGMARLWDLLLWVSSLQSCPGTR